MRPKSILWFEVIYLSALVVGLLQSYVAWDVQVDMLHTATQGQVGGGILIAYNAAFVVIGLALWFLVARLGSMIAQWVLIAFNAIGLVALTRAALSDGGAIDLAGGLSILTTVMVTAAIVMLFRADARAWMRGDDLAGEAPTA